MIKRRVVVFPAPLWPSSAVTWPGSMLNEMGSSRKSPNCALRPSTISGSRAPEGAVMESPFSAPGLKPCHPQPAAREEVQNPQNGSSEPCADRQLGLVPYDDESEMTAAEDKGEWEDGQHQRQRHRPLLALHQQSGSSQGPQFMVCRGRSHRSEEHTSELQSPM